MKRANHALPEPARVTIQPVRQEHDAQLATVIRSVMSDFRAEGPGFSREDTEVDAMSRAYRPPRARYFVATTGESEVLGGAGFGPLAEGPPDVCELRKMYLLEKARGAGLGAKLLRLVLEEARTVGYRWCYLESLSTMTTARALYERNGFRPIGGALGNTGHGGCDSYFLRAL